MRTRKVYEKLLGGEIVQCKGYSGCGIIAACPENQIPFYLVWTGGSTIDKFRAVKAEDIHSVGPQIGTIRLYAAKVRS